MRRSPVAVLIATALSCSVPASAQDELSQDVRNELSIDQLADSTSQISVTGTSMRLLRDERSGHNRMAVITQDLLYCYPPTRALIVVPEGYVTDFASVPVGADKVVSVYGNNMEAAIVHDWLYAVGEPGKRALADEIFRYALKEQGVSVTERLLAYEGVRIGGAQAYGKADEWAKRFYKTDGSGPDTPQFEKPKSAIVAVLPTCDVLNTANGTDRVAQAYASAKWPRSANTAPVQPIRRPKPKWFWQRQTNR